MFWMPVHVDRREPPARIRCQATVPAISVLLASDREFFRDFRMSGRRHQPVPLRCAVSLWKPSDGTFARTMTEHLTSSGFLCISKERYRPGDELEATLEVASDIALQCQVEVVRTEDPRSGLACRIKEYSVINPQPSIK